LPVAWLGRYRAATSRARRCLVRAILPRHLVHGKGARKLASPLRPVPPAALTARVRGAANRAAPAGTSGRKPTPSFPLRVNPVALDAAEEAWVRAGVQRHLSRAAYWEAAMQLVLWPEFAPDWIEDLLASLADGGAL
jgi:hypothetical protein